MSKKTPTDYETRQREALKGFFREPKWTAADWFKDIGITLLALIGSIIIIAVALLGITGGFGFL